MREFVRPAAYDLALSLFTSFGYFRHPEENQHVIENIHTSLRPGGSLVMDMLGKEILARIFPPTSAQEIPGGLLVERRQAINDWSMMHNQWILVAQGRQTTFDFEHWLYSGWELRQMLVAAGFRDIQLFGNLEGDPYGPAATRLVALARKAAV
jgi:SAM-dependent methyltransferase